MNNLPFLEEIYEQYRANPAQVDSSWRSFFENMELKSGILPRRQVEFVLSKGLDCRVCNLIRAYRTYGHLQAHINPLSTNEIEEPWQLKLEVNGFSSEDLSKEFPTCGLLKKEQATLEEIIQALKSIYCGTIGIEYMDLVDPEMESWIQDHIEPSLFHFNLTIDQKHTILQQLNESELFEVFLHTKYPGQKRFSLEGAETLIPILEGIIETSALSGGEDYVIGMAHRGRLNVLSNILKKSYVLIFSEFDENFIPESLEGSGDVKYHKGFYSKSLTIHGHKVNVALSPNPSHLEAVDPVVEGQVKAKQIQRDDNLSQNQAIPILVHGDAAISGQGVVYETLQLSRLSGYNTGGTIHIVINNQIGFTTIPKDCVPQILHRYCKSL